MMEDGAAARAATREDPEMLAVDPTVRSNELIIRMLLTTRQDGKNTFVYLDKVAEAVRPSMRKSRSSFRN